MIKTFDLFAIGVVMTWAAFSLHRIANALSRRR